MKKVSKKVTHSSDLRKIRRKITALIVLLLILIFFVYGFTMQTVKYEIESPEIENKTKIVFISDLHNCFYGGFDQSGLKENIDKENPDIILFGGDIADEYGGTDHAMEIVQYAVEKYPCYYAMGNHEEWRDDTEELKNTIAESGVTILEGDSSNLTVKGQNFQILGVTEPSYYDTEDKCTQLESCINQLDESAYNILLLHQPHQINECLSGNFDLILSGHAHGGQWRIPFILENGLWAPDQGLFPELTNGKYQYDNTTHIISKGLARPLRMIMIPRIYNRPEFTVIEIS